MTLCFPILRRDMRLLYSGGGGLVQQLMLIVLLTALFPFAIGPDAEALQPLALPVVWLVAFISTALYAHSSLADDYADGTLVQYFLLPGAGYQVLLAKWLGYLLGVGLVVSIATPALYALFSGADLPPLGQFVLLFLGLGLASMISLLQATLLLFSRRLYYLAPILAFPLYIPVIILGMAENGLAGLLGLWMLYLPLLLWLGTRACRSALG